MIFNDPATRWQIAIGAGATLSYPSGAVAIGRNSASRGDSVSVGQGAGLGSQGSHNVNFGYDAKCNSDYSVALGYSAKTTRDGEVNVGTGSENYGYNSTPYRIIGGVHDPVDAHDAATKGYVDGKMTTFYIDEANMPNSDTTETLSSFYKETSLSAPFTTQEVYEAVNNGMVCLGVVGGEGYVIRYYFEYILTNPNDYTNFDSKLVSNYGDGGEIEIIYSVQDQEFQLMYNAF
jgi:hypothetical protein